MRRPRAIAIAQAPAFPSQPNLSHPVAVGLRALVRVENGAPMDIFRRQVTSSAGSSHVAQANIAFSGVIGSQILGSPGASFSGYPTTTDQVVTLAAIGVVTSLLSSGEAFGESAASGGPTIGFASTTGNVHIRYGANVQVDSGLALTSNVPYFIACSMNRNLTTNNFNFVVANLLNGSVRTAVVSDSTGTQAAWGGTLSLGAGRTRTWTGSLSAGMLSIGQWASIAQLADWARDPWALWDAARNYGEPSFGIITTLLAIGARTLFGVRGVAAATCTASLAGQSGARVRGSAGGTYGASIGAHTLLAMFGRMPGFGGVLLARTMFMLSGRNSAAFAIAMAARAEARTHGAGGASYTAALAAQTRMQMQGRASLAASIALGARTAVRVVGRAGAAFAANLGAASRIVVAGRVNFDVHTALAGAARFMVRLRAFFARPPVTPDPKRTLHYDDGTRTLTYSDGNRTQEFTGGGE